MLVTYYDIGTGRIVGNAICSEEDALANKPANCNIVEEIIDGELFYIENNIPVSISPCPGQYYEFDFVTKEWINKKDETVESDLTRDQRNLLLSQSDWTQLPDVVLSNKEEWAVYRQELRDITSQPGFPTDIIWPIQPEGV